MVFPFENDNHKIIGRLAGRSFRASRMRNLVAVLAIALTAVLFTSVATIGMGTMESLKLTTQMQKMSRSDADLRYMTREQFEQLKGSDMVEQAGLRLPVGFLTNTQRHNAELDCTDAIQRELTFSQPTHGEEPKAANELVASDRALKDLGVEPKVGAEVTIEFTAHGKAYSLPMIVSGWYESLHDELSVISVPEAFMEAHPEIFTYTYREDGEMAGTYFSDITVKTTRDLQGQLEEFVASIGGNSKDIEASNYIAAIVNRDTNPQMGLGYQAAIVVLMLLFIFCGYLLIYNVFDIAVMQEVQRYGLYRTVGMSKRQVKMLINRQALWVTCLGIPLGLLIGFFTGRMTLPWIMDILSTEYRSLAVTVSPHPLIFVLAAALTALTVLISTRKPVRVAANISPMEAFRYVEAGGKKRKSKKATRGASLTRMAAANLGRNKRRSAFIMISLMLSIVMFNTVCTAAVSVDVERQVEMMIRTDFEIAHINTASNLKGFITRQDGVPQEAVLAVKEQSGVGEGSLVYKNTLEDQEVTFDYGAVISRLKKYEEQGISYLAGYDEEDRVVNVGADKYPLCSAFGMEQTGIERLKIAEGEKDPQILWEKLQAGNSLILGVDADRRTNELMEWMDYLDVGDTITARVDGRELKTYTIIAKAALTSDDQGYGFSTSGAVAVGGDGPYIYLPTDEYLELYRNPTVMKYAFNVAEKDQARMDEFLNTYIEETDSSLAYLSSESARENGEASRTMIYLVGGIIGFIFGITGILNLINMMSTSILARRREFATMQSIGMTKKQLKKLLMLEGSFYAIGAAVVGILLSAVVDATLLRTILSGGSMWMFTYHMTLVPAVLVTMLLLVISLLIPRGAMRLFYKGSVVEQLRFAE